MKIAVSSLNGRTICKHSTECKDYILFELNNDQTIKQKKVSLQTQDCLSNISGTLSQHPKHPLNGIDTFITLALSDAEKNRLSKDGIEVIQTTEIEPLNVINGLTLTLK